MPTLNISLTPELAEFVEHEVASGRYSSASELVSEGLFLLEMEEEVRAEKEAALKAAVQTGIDQADRGEFSTRTFDEIVTAALAER